MMAQSKRLRDAYTAAERRIGMKEVTGAEHNPDIVDFFKAVGHGWVKDDETAWCAAFVGAMLREAGVDGTGKLNARSYLDFGTEISLDDAKPGDLVIFWRGSKDGWMGHVGFYKSHGKTFISVLGGNQSNSVNIARYNRNKLLGVRTMLVEEEAPEPQSWLSLLITLLKGLRR